MVAMAGAIEAAATRYALDPGEQWAPGRPLRLLLAGYTGSRNTGADVRVEEMIRQFRHLFGDDHLELSILTNDPALTRGYFRTVEQLTLPKFFPPFLVDAVHRHHGVIACEGSMFKSKFANALSTMMVGALGLAAAENKLAVGYGGEAGSMDPTLERLVERYCASARILARNEHSVATLGRLGIRAEAGTDTAWTFSPAPPEVGARILRDAGWDGIAPVLIACPINAFWWPVRPDLGKAAARALTGAYARDHYAAFYFHAGGPDTKRRQEAYIAAMAEGIRPFARARAAFVACVGMEQLDRSACEALADALGGAPVLVSDEHDMYALVSVLRRGRWMVTSRYHAAVTSMPGGVLSIGVTMDERLANLMADRGQPDLCLRVDEPELGPRLRLALERVDRDENAVRDGIEASVARALEQMGRMGARLVAWARERYPALPVRDGLGDPDRPWEHLPPLSPELRALVERHRAARSA
jgi:polysaccharide pyruvyl transferase WcaK-like protein